MHNFTSSASDFESLFPCTTTCYITMPRSTGHSVYCWPRTSFAASSCRQGMAFTLAFGKSRHQPGQGLEMQKPISGG